jgi:hypothetical protein
MGTQKIRPHCGSRKVVNILGGLPGDRLHRKGDINAFLRTNDVPSEDRA